MPKAFESEAALCAAFLAAIDAEVWTAYAETSGWDILLVRKADGVQIGIEAKLRMNTDVLTQALEEYGASSADRAGPDFRAVLVPEGTGGFGRICEYIGVTIIVMHKPPDPSIAHRMRGAKKFDPELPVKDDWNMRNWHDWWPVRREWLPAYVPDVRAGMPSPLQLTDWKICALKVQVTLELRGYVTREDFKHIGIDHRRWLGAQSQFGMMQSEVRGRYTHAGLGFHREHPKVYAQIKAEAERWMRKAGDDDPPTLSLTTAPESS